MKSWNLPRKDTRTTLVDGTFDFQQSPGEGRVSFHDKGGFSVFSKHVNRAKRFLAERVIIQGCQGENGRFDGIARGILSIEFARFAHRRKIKRESFPIREGVLWTRGGWETREKREIRSIFCDGLQRFPAIGISQSFLSAVLSRDARLLLFPYSANLFGKCRLSVTRLYALDT